MPLPNSVIDRVANARLVLKEIVASIERLPADWRPNSTADSLWCDDLQWLHDRICGGRKYGNLDISVTLAAVSLLLAEREANGCKSEAPAAA